MKGLLLFIPKDCSFFLDFASYYFWANIIQSNWKKDTTRTYQLTWIPLSRNPSSCTLCSKEKKIKYCNFIIIAGIMFLLLSCRSTTLKNYPELTQLNKKIFSYCRVWWKNHTYTDRFQLFYCQINNWHIFPRAMKSFKQNQEWTSHSGIRGTWFNRLDINNN